MKKKIKFMIVSFILVTLVYIITSSDEVQAVSSDEAGKYVAEFAINFFDAHASETTYGTSGRTAAYEGKKYGGVYNFDCVGWLGFAVHQSLGIGADYYTEFAVPYHGNPNPGYFNGYTQVYGSGGSGIAIPLDDLKEQLKPGDLLMAKGPRKHVLIYVGDGTLIHCTGHGPGSEYGGDNGYGLIKETVDHFYEANGIEAIGRLTEEASASINESELTTVFGETGKSLTGIWEKASSGTSSSGWDTSNNSSSSGSSSSSASKFSVTGMNEDYNLGLRYPKDNNNTPLNSFIDFTAPFLQTWMIPLAMNSGALDAAGSTDKGKNPIFSYITIKEAMSDILVNRYDITKCTLKTKYKVYDVITYQVTYDKDGNKYTEEVSRYSVDESSNGPMAEEFVNKSFDVSTKYCIKKAYTFDVKIENEYDYEPYNDYDVENRVGADSEQKEIGAPYSEGGDPGGNGEDSYTYTKKEGNYINVTRIWQDKFEIGTSNINEYTVDDVREYVSNSSNSSFNLNGEIYECTKYDLTEDQKIKLAQIVYAEYGADIDGMKAVASHMANLYEHRKWSKAISESKSLYDYISTTSWYDSRSRSNTNYNDDALKAVEDCIVNGKRVMPPYIDEFCTFASKYISPYYEDTSKYVQGETKVTQLFSGSPEGTFWTVTTTGSGGNIFFYTSEKYKEYCEGTSNSKKVSNNSNNTNQEDTSDLDYFTFTDSDYYYLLYVDKSINRVDFVNARPENYLQYMRKGSQYSNHVGYSRGYLAFAYDELKRLFNEKFGENSTLPFVYGSSLGYSTYTAKNEMDAGTVTGDVGGGSGSRISKQGVVNVPDGLGETHTVTYWDTQSWDEGTLQKKLIDELSGGGTKIQGNISVNSKGAILYGDWFAGAMVEEFGGTQGSPEMTISVGDLMIIVQEDGTFYPVMVADIKQQQWNNDSRDNNPANEWGHLNGHCIVENEMKKSMACASYGAVDTRMNKHVSQVYRVGNYWENKELLNNIDEAAKQAGLDPANMIRPNI